MPALTLVQYPGFDRRTTFSPPCGKVHMALQFKGLDYEVKNAGNPKDVKRYNPRGRVPVLLLGEEVIADSSDILDALDTHYPDKPLLPAGERAIAQALVLEDWADEVLYFYGAWLRWGVPENFERFCGQAFARLPFLLRPIVKRVARREALARFSGQGVGLKGEAVVRRETEACLDRIEGLLSERDYLAGDGFSRADLSVCCLVDHMAVPELTPTLAERVEAREVLGAWRKRVHEHTGCDGLGRASPAS